jgi:hypothetical protein
LTRVPNRWIEPCYGLAVLTSETGSDHLQVIAEEVSRVAELCIAQDMGRLGAATSFIEMEAGSVN